jgi:hypothetical protein
MARWLDQLTQREEEKLRALLQSLHRAKPAGWSVVWRQNEISIRPGNRAAGRFSVVFGERHGFMLAFFRRKAGIWDKRQTFADTPSAYSGILDWMQQVAQEAEQ